MRHPIHTQPAHFSCLHDRRCLLWFGLVFVFCFFYLGGVKLVKVLRLQQLEDICLCGVCGQLIVWSFVRQLFLFFEFSKMKLQPADIQPVLRCK